MLYLQDLAKQKEQTTQLVITERLPVFLLAPCHLSVTYQVEAKDDYYLIHLAVNGSLRIVCQRCMLAFDTPYANQTTLAVCKDDVKAEALLALYECFVSSNGLISLEDAVVDELHLYAPQYHPDTGACDQKAIQILTENYQCPQNFIQL